MPEFLPVLQLVNLNGTNGFRLDGVAAGDFSGFTVSTAGDINGDGFADIVISALGANAVAGASYVVFGKASSFGATFNLSGLNGANGFRLDGIDAADYSGRAVSSAGDVNGDGFDDLVIGAPTADPGGDSEAGESYVVFGKAAGFGASPDLAALNGANGFRIDGVNADEFSGYAVSAAGDVNGDGIDDILIGAPGSGSAGQSFVVFGRGASSGGFGASVDLATLDGGNGFRINGINAADRTGAAVAAAGDINGDGLDDILIGAPDADPGTADSAGESYVVFGKSAFGGVLNLNTLDGTAGFRMVGNSPDERNGWSVSAAGDVNADGFADFVVGSFGANVNSGFSYVVFGKASSFGASLDLTTLNGANGFRIDGFDPGDQSGRSVSSAGDVNGDGFGDILIGAPSAFAGGDQDAGETYVVFGRASGFAATLQLSALDGSNGFRIDGIDTMDFSGFSVSGAGDIDGDGFDDILIGARGGDPGGRNNAGESYVVFGHEALEAVVREGTDIANRINGGVGDDTIYGGGDNDTLLGRAGNDTLYGEAGADTMIGGTQNDTYFVNNAGDNVTELLNQGYDIINTTLASLVLAANVERLNSNGAANFVGTGNNLANRFQSLGGDDRFIDVAGGADIFSGGNGTDTVDFRSSATGIVLRFTNNVHGGAATGDSYASIEKFLGSNTANDAMTMGGTGRALFVGGGGNDTLRGAVKNDQLIGQAGNDILIGAADRDSLDGGTGNDTMTGGSEGDVFVFIDAPFGQDTIIDYQDGLDSFKVFSAVADNIADFTIAGNGTTSVTLTLSAAPANTITINGTAPITITGADFVFY